MRKSLQFKILVSVLAWSFFSINSGEGIAFADNTNITSTSESVNGDTCYIGINGSSNNKVKIDTSILYAGITGGYDKNGSEGAIDNIVNIIGTTTTKTTIGGYVYGGYSESGIVNNNNIDISNSDIKGTVYGGASKNSEVSNNQVTVDSSSIKTSIYGGFSINGEVSNNQVIVNNSEATYIYGGKSNGNANNNQVTIEGNTLIKDTVDGGNSIDGYVNNNKVNIKSGTINGKVRGGLGDKEVSDNIVNISGGTINNEIYGGYSYRDISNRNKVNISGGIINGNVYGGCAYTSSNENEVNISGSANIENANLYGSKVINGKGNTLNIDGWSGNTKSVQYFDTINFENIKWQDKENILNITDNKTKGSLANTKININNLVFKGGTQLNVGESMNFISGNDLKIDENNVTATKDFTAGVTVGGTGQAQVVDDGNRVTYTLTAIKHLDQIDLVAENRAVAAAFVNQGTDLISESLDALSRDDKYGIKTFAAIHGNRSQYDVNSDLKINGWSSIVGIGNEKNVGTGDFIWGIFYENGSGNYRTYNEFNNEFFRGDGNLVYNGGGIVARFEQDNGVYTEGSLRAGMLKSEMTNALKDGVGNSYGYKSESTYYGAHIGIGKIINLNKNTDIDIYSKFFHTYTDGDSFEIANDKFEFDSITSDRLRIGAKLTTNKENKFSTYYGLAYEYEFNGDADMRAQSMSIPEQSLQGSSYMVEIGMNYKPSSISPWSFDLSMRGYVGQREGFSGNIQANYIF